MAISGSQKLLSDFLSQRKQYIVPRYQRGYVWEEKQWKDLFDDLKLNYFRGATEGHFIGSIVIYDKQEVDFNKSSVIDGQQRITTFLLLILVIMRKADLLGKRALFDGMKLYVKAQTPSGIKYDKFYNEHNPYFKEVLDACSEWHDDKSVITNNLDIVKKKYSFEEKFIKNCFFTLFSLLDEAYVQGLDLSAFANKVMSTIVIETISTDIKESYTVFEILNARGRPLESFELIKNYIMKNYETTTSPDEALVKWNNLIELLTQNNVVLKDFFDHYVSYKYKKNFDGKKKEKFTTYDYVKKNNIDNKADILLNDLIEVSKYYVIFNNPTKNMDMSQEEHSYKILNSLLFFKGRGRKQFRPLFLSLFSRYYTINEADEERKKANYKKLADLMEFLENFYFTYGVVLRGPTRQFEKIVHDLAFKISSSDDASFEIEVEQIFKTLAALMPNYATFEKAFCNLGYSTKNIRYGDEEGNKEDVKYILSKYEQYLRRSSKNIEPFSIEHIYKDNGKDANCQIGNLTCLEEPVNNQLGSKQVKTKLTYYEGSIFESAKEIVRIFDKEWLPPQIEARGKNMAYVLYHSIWEDKE